jgi:Putative Actinobacterial Holin-X, holin superfamily III
MTDHSTAAGDTAGGTFAEEMAALVQAEVEQVTASLRAELDQLRQNALEKAGEAARGTALLGVAGGLALTSVGALSALPVLAMRRVIPGWAVAVLVSGGAATGAAFVGKAGLARLEAAAPEAVRERVDQAKADVAEVLKDRVNPSP